MCCELSCRVFVFKICFVNIISNTITFVSSPDDDDNSDSDTDYDSYSDSDLDETLLEPLTWDDDNDLYMDKINIDTNINEEDDNIIEEDNI